MPDSDGSALTARAPARGGAVRLRPARAGDAPELYRLSAPSMPDALIERRPEFYRRHAGEFLVCDVAGRIAGCLGVQRLGGLAELYNVCVGARWRGRGLGGLLTASAVLLLHLDGVPEVVLFSRTTVTWFTWLGFKPADESILPAERRDLIDRGRGSQLLCRPTRPDHLLIAALRGTASVPKDANVA
ncbi:MAG TPA: GNAT family N-acetyltransferase [Actinophytocola sp.]|uniref:GNAT family N-acetyltransferase n=1 Tax=Actinophytocola sp. TaxID=1872138 RepID=UPI002DDD40A8|nr:GNAT family N-acetyltransferase [Actinophytocola sp.]HEV2780522.1 GNAT family N-acetyltransferase [Actinophytocola sp.]